MGIDFGVILAADFNNVIRFYVCRPGRQLRLTSRLLSHQCSNRKDMYNVMGIDFGVILAADVKNALRFEIRLPAPFHSVIRRPLLK